MGTTNDKLNYLAETKKQIKESFNTNGVEVTDEDTFRSYADKINEVRKRKPQQVTVLVEPGYLPSTYTSDKNNTMSLGITSIEDCCPEGLLTNMNDLFKDLSKLETVKLFDTSKVTSMARTFYRCSKLREIAKLDTSNVTDMSYMFYYCSVLQAIPELDVGNVKNMSYMFYNCSNIATIPELNTRSATDMSYMFKGCSSLEKVTSLDTTNVTNMTYMFEKCGKLKSISQLDISNVTNMYHMFFECSDLTTISLVDNNGEIEHITDTRYMFAKCTSLNNINIPKLNTKNVTNMSYMFQDCTSLKNIPELDTSNVTDMNSMFLGADLTGVENMPKLDTHNVTNMDQMFSSCKIETLQELDCSSVTHVPTFGTTTSASLKNLGGFKNLGKAYTQKSTEYGSYCLSLKYCTNLTHESLMNVINGLYDLNLTYDVANEGTLYKQSLILPSTLINSLTADEKKIATDKGWNIKTS